MTALAVLVLALAGGSAGIIGPALIAHLPEPVEPPEGKRLYREIVAVPGLGPWLSSAGAVLGAVAGAGIGWHSSLLPWSYLIALGVVLSYIDLTTRLLPTRLIAPSYGVIVGLIGLAAAIQGGTHLLLSAGLGWLIVGSFYFVPWLIYPRGVGYGDVRLSGLLGLALGCVGWQAALVGGWLGIFLGVLSGLALRPFTGVKMNAHGPAMVAGAVAGVAWGVPIMHAFQR